MAAHGDVEPAKGPRETREDVPREPQPSRPNGRGAERRRYFIAGAAACVATQLMILGGIAVTRYVVDAVRDRAVTVAPPASAPPAAVTSTPAALPLPVATSVPEPVVSTPPSAPAVISTPVAPPSRPSTSVVSPSRPPVQPSVATLPPSPRPPVVGTADWTESQAELRSALERWLIIEDRDDMRFADAEVILGPDGATAKTRVPSARGGGRIVEQRWQRRPNGWVIVDHREIGGLRQ